MRVLLTFFQIIHFHLQLVVIYCQPLRHGISIKNVALTPTRTVLFKRSEQNNIFDKELQVTYLPSETDLAIKNSSKLPIRKAGFPSKLPERAQKRKQPTTYKYTPRKEASDYSQSKQAQEQMKRIARMRQNDQTKYAEYLKKGRIRKNKSIERTKNDPEVQKRREQSNRKHKEKIKLLRFKVRNGTADEKEKLFITTIRQREREHKAKTAKSKQTQTSSD